MERNFGLYLKLFTSTFMLSAFTFGGGYVIVPLMRKKFVQEYEWIEENEMLDLVAIAQSSPGVMAVNTSILIGYRMAGVFGSLITVLGTVLPPLIIISLVSIFYDQFKASWYANTFLIGMRSGVAAMIIDVVIKMVQGVLNERSLFSVSILILTLAISLIFDISISYFLLFGAFSGTLLHYQQIYLERSTK